MGHTCEKCFEDRYGFKTNIKMDLTEEWFLYADWNEMSQDRVHLWTFVNMVMNFYVP
jgi:hypothetical protein